MFEHDYKKFPELTNSQLQVLQLSSPHVQITEDFEAVVVKVHDADTITLKTEFRDFNFPLRILDIDAPELSEESGKEAQTWLETRLLNESVQVIINKSQRVGKYGRLLGHVMHRGLSVAEEMLHLGIVKKFGERREGEPEPISKILRQKWH